MFKAHDRLATHGRRAVAVVLKITERCNLACTYCYFFFGGDGTFAQHAPLMKGETAADIGAFLGRAAEELDLDSIEVALHGGEPLLMKPDAFSALVETIRRAIPARCKLLLTVQTNGMLVSDRWIEVFSHHGIGVGVSIDGPRAHNDRWRLDKRGQGSFDRAVAGWRLLKEAAAAGRIGEPGILSVIDADAPEDLLPFFTDELGARSINFLLPDVTHDDNKRTSREIELIGQAMTRIFDDWSARKDAGIRVRFIRDALLPMISESVPTGSNISKEDLWRAITISSDGDVYVEDTLRGVFASSSANAQDVRNSRLGDILESPDWARVADGVDRLGTRCESCRYRSVCRGGSMVSRYSRANGFQNPSVYCEALFAFHAHVERRVRLAGRLHTGFDRLAEVPKIAEEVLSP